MLTTQTLHKYRGGSVGLGQGVFDIAERISITIYYYHHYYLSYAYNKYYAWTCYVCDRLLAQYGDGIGLSPKGRLLLSLSPRSV